MPEEQQKNYSRKFDGKEAIEVVDASKEDYDKWMNIDMAVAVLGKGDRQIRRYIVKYNWETRWLKEDGKVKTFILKERVLDFLEKRKEGEIDDKEEDEKPATLPERSEIQSYPDTPFFAAIKQVGAELSLTLPELVKSYKTINETVHKLTEEKARVVNQVTIWKSSTIWIGITTIIVCGIVGYHYFESKSELSKSKDELTVIRQEKDNLKDKFSATEKELISSQHVVEEKSAQIQKLEEKVNLFENPNRKNVLGSPDSPNEQQGRGVNE